MGRCVGTLPTLRDILAQGVGRLLNVVEPTLCVRRMHPTDVGSMFSTYEQVYTYILKMACKVRLP